MTEEKETFLYIRGVPKRLKKEFKSECAKNGTTMTEEVLRFMKKYVNKQLNIW